MTDLVVSVKLRAQASELTAPLKEAKGELAAVGAAAAAAGAEAKGFAAGADQAAAAAEALAADTRQASAAAEALAADSRQLTTALGATSGAQRRHTEAVNDNAKAARGQQFAIRNAGQQVGDFGLQVASGGSVAQAFSQQIGQMGYALSEMGGKAGKVGAFLTGPWGIALTIGAAVAAPFIESLFTAGNAAEDARVKNAGLIGILESSKSSWEDVTAAARDYADQQARTNRTTIATIQLEAEAIRKRLEGAVAIRKQIAALLDLYTQQARSAPTGLNGQGQIGAAVGAAFIGAQSGQNDKLITELERAKAAVNIKLATAAADAQSDPRKRIAARFDELRSQAKGSIKDIDALTARLVALNKAEAAQTAAATKKPKAAKKAKVDATTPREAEEIQRFNEAFDRTPSLIDKAAQATRRLDDIIADLVKRKPPGFEKLIADARVAQFVIEQGLTRPFRDFIEQQGRSFEIGQLILRGRQDEADQLRIIQQLEANGPVISEAQRAAILGTVQALRLQERQIEVVQRKQRILLSQVSDTKAIIADTIYRGPDALKDLPVRIFDSFKRAQADFITEKVFGPLFDALGDEIKGGTKPSIEAIETASSEMASALDAATASIDNFSNAIGSAGGDVPAGGEAFGGNFAATFQRELDKLNKGQQDIVVEGRKRKDPATVFGSTIEKFGLKIGLPENVAKDIGKYAGAGIKGIFEGQAASGIASLIGIKQSSAGASIGGGIGGILGSIGPIASALGPFGAALGPVLGLLGGTIGGLFIKPKFGTASISNNDDKATVGGNNAEVKKAAGGLAASVQSGIKQIGQQLGAELGSYKVSIGTFDGKYRVSTTGFTGSLDNKKAKGQGLVDFGKDGQAEAISYAIADAIKDGAVKGLSAAVQKALTSTTDIEEGLSQALKVQNLELLIGGIGATLNKTFDDFDREANDRVSLARKYGLDLNRVEKLNAEERVKLIDDTLKSRVASLKDFLTNVKYGDLYEGSASDRRNAILADIKTAQADAEAGVAGAADTLAQLYRTLTETSKDAFGTAGPEFAADRSTAISGVERVIGIEQERVRAAAAAQAEQTGAIREGNALTSEANSYLAEIANRQGELVDLFRSGAFSGTVENNLAATLRSSQSSFGIG